MFLTDHRFPQNSLPILPALHSGKAMRWNASRSIRDRYAVLLLFLPPAANGESARLVLTKRADNLRLHRGQISLAGGRADPADDSPSTTALREASEELGLSPSSVVVHGHLPATKALNGGIVIPVVASAAITEAKLQANPSEVAEIFVVPWTNFTIQESQEFEFNVFGQWRRSHYFGASTPKVWGLTAKILHLADMLPSDGGLMRSSSSG